MSTVAKDAGKPKKYGPYSVVREAGPFVFVSGQVGIDPETGIASPNVADQTRQVMHNIGAALDTVGLGLGNVVDTTIFLTNVGEDFGSVNDVYAAALQTAYRAEQPGITEDAMTDHYPARACAGVADLPHVGDMPLHVEIKAIAMRTP